MKLHLPKKFQTALMAAFATVSFTTVSTASLGAAIFAFAGYQAAAEEVDSSDQSEAGKAGQEEIRDNIRILQEKQDEENERETTVDPVDWDVMERRAKNLERAGDAAASQIAREAYEQMEAEMFTPAPSAAPAQQQTSTGSGELPSDDLGFTTNPYASSSPANSGPVFEVTPAAPAADFLLETSTEQESTSPSSSGSSTPAPASSSGFGGSAAGGYIPFGHVSSNSIPLGSVAPISVGATGSLVSAPLLGGLTQGRDLIWQGGAGNWDTESKNWYVNGSYEQKVAFDNGDNVSFSVQVDSPVILQKSVTAGDVTIANGVYVSLFSEGAMLTANNITVEGNLMVTNVAITATSMTIAEGSYATANVEGTRTGMLATNVSGEGSVTKTGTGTLALTGDNTGFTGVLTIEQGTVIASNAEGKALGNTPNVVMQGGTLAGQVSAAGNINIDATASSSVTATMAVADSAQLTFNTEGTAILTTTGAISGDGGIIKDGTGTLVLNAENTFAGNLTINAGIVQVGNVSALGGAGSRNVSVANGGNLVFDSSVEGIFQADTISLNRGSSLVFSGTEQLNIGTLSLASEAALDLSNIALDQTGTYLLATVDKLDVSEVGIWKSGQDLVQFISMTGIHGSALSDNTITSLHYNENTKQLTLQLDGPTDGFYWIPQNQKEKWDTGTANWSTSSSLENPTTYKNQLQNPYSAFFLNAGEGEEHTQNVELQMANVYVHDFILAGGKENAVATYNFTCNAGEGNIIMDRNRLSNFVVRSYTEANFDGVTVTGGENSVAHICKNAAANFRNVGVWDIYSLNNEGRITVDFATDSPFVDGLMGHLDNTGYISVTLKSNDTPSWIRIGDAVNREGATLELSAPELYADVSYGDGIIHNMGNLVFGLTDTAFEGTMHSRLPIDGTGHFKTQGAYSIQQSGTVEQGSMELGANHTQFDANVTISDSTTVKSGAEATFTGGGSLGRVTLERGDWEDVTHLEFAGNGDSAVSYQAGKVTADEYSYLDVDNGAELTITGFNADRTMNGTITVGTGTGSTDAKLTVDGLANVGTLNMKNGTASLNSYAAVGALQQSGGTVEFNAGGYLFDGEVSGGTLVIGNGESLMLGQAITQTGNYTVAETTGSINADNLTLEKDMENAGYLEVGATETTKTQSGFLKGGQQYVKVFDIQNGATLDGNDVTVTHRDAAGDMKLISEGQYAGYGYLDASETIYATYYVRDNYVSGQHGTRSGSDRTPDNVKLSQVIDAATQGGATLATVMFDKTEYNQGEANVHGSITVDVQEQNVDLFSVAQGAKGVVNIGTDADGQRVVLTCSEDYQGVNGNLYLAGTGIYKLENRGTLGNGVSLLEDTTEGINPWTGTVRLTGSAEKVDMGLLSVGEGDSASEIEFDHWSGSFAESEEYPLVSDAKIRLTGRGITDAPAITLAEGNAALFWTNTVTGDGARVVHHEGGDLHLIMTGDTSGWTGTFDQGAADTTVQLVFQLDGTSESGQHEHADEQNTDVLVSNGKLEVVYGGDLRTVTGDALVYGQGDLHLRYTGSEMTVSSVITQFQDQGNLTITVGDGLGTTQATFNGTFSETQNATMHVEDNSTALLATDAELLRVVGNAGSNVVVSEGKKLSLASDNPELGYSQFYGVNNQGTIQMKASGGDIKLIDTADHEAAFNLGDLELTGAPGTASIETSGVNDQVTSVNITALRNSGSDEQVLKLTNDNGVGTVNYNLGGEASTADFSGTVAYGGNGGETNLVLKGDSVAANSVLETRFSEGAPDGSAANIVVDTAAAKVLGLTSDAYSEGKTMVVHGSEGDANKSLSITGNDEYTYAGKLGKGLDIAYTGNGSQTINGGVDGFNGAVTVNNGSNEAGVLEILNAAEVSITDLTIGANDKLSIENTQATKPGTAVVSGTLAALGSSTSDGEGNPSKLYGNLTLGNTSTLDVSAAGGTGGLDLFGALTINSGAMLSAADMAIVWNMKVDEKYDLAFSVTDMSSFGSVDWEQGVDASTVFGNGMKEGEFYIRYSQNEKGGNGNNVGAVYLFRMAVPEPATSTLSLLALAALAARRRRK